MINTYDKGFGDTMERLMKKTGIKKLVKNIDPDCGCEKRQEWLNKKIPYKK